MIVLSLIILQYYTRRIPMIKLIDDFTHEITIDTNKVDECKILTLLDYVSVNVERHLIDYKLTDENIVKVVTYDMNYDQYCDIKRILG